MIQLSSAGKRFGPKLLFDNLDWLITPNERVGLVGANGTGKSTLLKVLGGLESLDYGSIISAKNTTFGYLPQDGLQLSGRTVFDECMSVFSNLQALEQEMEDLAHKIAELDHTSSEYAQVADRYQRILGEFRVKDGYALDSQVGTVLDGLGFRKEDWTRYTEEFSGAGKCGSHWPSCCCPSQTCCCSTSPRTTSTSKLAIGWSSICCSIRLPTCSSRTTAIFSMSR
jgi:ATP-binding cassette subfamily F protein 3